MKPFKAYVNFYKRFREEKVMLDKKLIAFVGPNEAGKSSFFEALLSIEDIDTPYENRMLHKGAEVSDDDVIVKVEYIIEKDEYEVLKEFNGIVKPNFFVIEKHKDGSTFTSFSKEIKRDKTIRKKIKSELSSLISNGHLSKRLKKTIVDLEEWDENNFLEIIQSLILDNEWNEESISSEFHKELDDFILALRNETTSFPVTQKNKISNVFDLYEEFKEIENLEHPEDLFLDFLESRRPKFLLFSNEDRVLKGSYQVGELEQNPRSLINLLDLAEISISEVIDVLKPSETTLRVDLEDKANRNLKNKFKLSWSQARVCPRFRFGVNTLNIVVDSSKGVNELRDRSQGLRQYISMRAFLEKKNLDIKPVLLIDEAEIHLHYNAQADLVYDFEQQEIVNSIFYTTHSIGCLPSDLGTGVRVVEPKFVEQEDTGVSIIRNSIWRNNGGFSPLLLAMGANFIAFTPARKAIITEGPSDPILLPRIFREALGLEFLEFQIAPGIAVVSPASVKNFELEASKVCYLLDGDEGGNLNRKKLIENGIGKEKIIQLSKNYSTEDFVKLELLVDAVQKEFETKGYEIPKFDIKGIGNYQRLNFLENQCCKLLGFPSKVRIAESVVSNNPSNIKILDSKSKPLVIEIYNKIKEVLDS